MGTYQYSRLKGMVGKRLQDAGHVTYLDVDIQDAANIAQQAVALVRPDSTALYASVQLAEGTKQAIPAGGLRLLDVTRNMGADGATPGDTILRAHRDIKDSITRSWHAAATATTVLEWLYDDREPHTFYVSPPIPASPDVYAEILYSKAPTDIDEDTDTITVDDIYVPAMLEYMLFWLWGGDREDNPNYERAANCFRKFESLMGVKGQADAVTSPKQRGHLK